MSSNFRIMCGEATFHIKGSLERREGGPGGACLAQSSWGDSGDLEWEERQTKVVRRRVRKSHRTLMGVPEEVSARDADVCGECVPTAQKDSAPSQRTDVGQQGKVAGTQGAS